MTKIALITDTHFGVRNDNPIFYDFMEKFYKNVFFPYLDKENIKNVIHLGDLVDRRKYINYVTAAKIHKIFMQPIKDRDINLCMIAGNHDCYYKNSNKINAIKQLYGEWENPKFHAYWDKSAEITFDKTKILLIPWLSPENKDRFLKDIENTPAPVLMGHFEINGFLMHQGTVCTNGIDSSIFKKFQEVFSGHFHEPSKIGNIRYLGAPYEMTWADTVTKKGFHVFDTENMSLETIHNPFKIFYKFEYDDTKMKLDDVLNRIEKSENLKNVFLKIIVKKKNNPQMFDLMLEKFHEKGVFDIKIIDDNKNKIENQQQIINEAEDTTVIIKRYVDNLVTDLNKDDINSLMQDLYKEAHF